MKHIRREDLEPEILEVINCAMGVGGQYIARYKLVQGDDDWILYLYFFQEQAPLMIARQGTWEDFKIFVANEIRVRKMQHATYWEAFQELPSWYLDDEGCWQLDYIDDLIT